MIHTDDLDQRFHAELSCLGDDAVWKVRRCRHSRTTVGRCYRLNRITWIGLGRAVSNIRFTEDKGNCGRHTVDIDRPDRSVVAVVSSKAFAIVREPDVGDMVLGAGEEQALNLIGIGVGQAGGRR